MRVRTAAAIGLGYFLGTRAGQKRYDQIRRLFKDVTRSETFGQVVDRGRDTLAHGVQRVTGQRPGWANGRNSRSSGEPEPEEDTGGPASSSRGSGASGALEGS